VFSKADLIGFKLWKRIRVILFHHRNQHFSQIFHCSEVDSKRLMQEVKYIYLNIKHIYIDQANTEK